jgi:hypothetical protein
MKQYRRKITATVNAMLIALALVGLNADHAIAQGKAGKGAKVRAHSNAKIAKTPGPKQASMMDYMGSPVVTYKSQRRRAQPGSATFASNPQNAENARSQTMSQTRRKNVAGAEGFSIDIGTSENIRFQPGGARRKATKRARR